MTLLDATNKFYYNMALGELRFSNKNLREASITYNSLLYLDLINYTDNCTASYLAELLNIAKSSVTLKINELIKLGLVIKTQSKNDKRIFFLTVTPETAKQYQAYNKAHLFAVEQMQKNYSTEDIYKFGEMITAFTDYYEEGSKNV